MLKGEYLQTIETAGFQDIKGVDKTHFPVDLMTDDPTGKAIIDNLHLSSEKLKETPNSVAIVKVYAVKPSLSAQRRAGWPNDTASKEDRNEW